MTYISRRSRIIVSRWSDECGPENSLQASERKNDGRLKKHISCDDLRAWVNNNCIKHEHFMDLMSNGEYVEKPSYRLYGRIIPVPVLFELLQNKSESKEATSGGTVKSKTGAGSEAATRRNFESSSDRWKEDQSNQEKYLLQKTLYECTSLLSKAVCKLEKIDGVVEETNEEMDNARNEEIQNAFYKSKLLCCSKSSDNNSSDNLCQSKSYVKKARDAAKCTELMRKISSLREKLKKIQECRREIKEQIRSSRRRTERNSSSLQVTELYSCREHVHRKRLQKKVERLIAERGRLLSQMCQALTCLKNLKRSSRSSMSFQRRHSKDCEDFHNDCAEDVGSCNSYDNSDSSDSGKVCSESSSNECFENGNADDGQMRKCSYYASAPGFSIGAPSQRNSAFDYVEDGVCQNTETYTNQSSGTFTGKPGKEKSSSKVRLSYREDDKGRTQTASTSTLVYSKSGGTKNQKNFRSSANEKRKEQKLKTKKKLKFMCPEPSCKKGYKESLSDFSNSLTPEQQALIQNALKNIQKTRSNYFVASGREENADKTKTSGFRRDENSPGRRPSTSPITRAEKGSLDGARNMGCVPERRIKSETTMKDIEKTLRNYEVRLGNVEGLDYKVEELKHKLLDENRLRQQIAKQRADERKARAAEREKSNREITQLCSENWELKKQVQQLTANFKTQFQKIQSLKCTVKKARELACEAEELKKELSEYRDSFEHQRECIIKWESVVALQRTEIENLMNHIRKLTTVKDGMPCSPNSQKKNIQRSRSYSPEMVRTRGGSRQKRQAIVQRMSSEDEECRCCCDDHRQQEDRRQFQDRSVDYGYCPPSPPRRTDWSMN